MEPYLSEVIENNRADTAIEPPLQYGIIKIWDGTLLDLSKVVAIQPAQCHSYQGTHSVAIIDVMNGQQIKRFYEFEYYDELFNDGVRYYRLLNGKYQSKNGGIFEVQFDRKPNKFDFKASLVSWETVPASQYASIAKLQEQIDILSNKWIEYKKLQTNPL